LFVQGTGRGEKPSITAGGGRPTVRGARTQKKTLANGHGGQTPWGMGATLQKKKIMENEGGRQGRTWGLVSGKNANLAKNAVGGVQTQGEQKGLLPSKKKKSSQKKRRRKRRKRG